MAQDTEPTVTLVCEQCQQPFDVSWYKRNRQRFCSKACVNRSRANPYRDVTCEGCGAIFTVPWHLRTRSHCSQACANRRPRTGFAPAKYGSKTCESCGEGYSPMSAPQRWCRVCIPDKVAYQRMLKYGVTYPVWIGMLDRHDGMCWVCRNRPAVSLDHDHATGHPRGVTCQKCNVALHYAENAEWLEKAQAYLKGVSADGFQRKRRQ